MSRPQEMEESTSGSLDVLQGLVVLGSLLAPYLHDIQGSLTTPCLTVGRLGSGSPEAIASFQEDYARSMDQIRAQTAEARALMTLLRPPVRICEANDVLVAMDLTCSSLRVETPRYDRPPSSLALQVSVAPVGLALAMGAHWLSGQHPGASSLGVRALEAALSPETPNLLRRWCVFELHGEEAPSQFVPCTVEPSVGQRKTLSLIPLQELARQERGQLLTAVEAGPPGLQLRLPLHQTGIGP